MDNKGNSKLVRQIVIFVVVFASAFLATRYLAKTYLKTSNQPAVETSDKTQTP